MIAIAPRVNQVPHLFLLNVVLHFVEVAQAAFSPSNIVPGLGFSPDKRLQARVLSYHASLAMTQRYIEGDPEAKRELVGLI